MKILMLSRIGRALRRENGQVLPLVALSMIGLLGMGALVMDVGDFYYSYHELQASTNAAALAGAEGLPTSGALALSNAQAYSSVSTGKNALGNLKITNFTATLGCATSGAAASIPCIATGESTGASKANAIQVSQTAKVPLYFAALFGHTSMSITATGTALMAGGGGTPYNIAIVIDTTESMSTADDNCVESETTTTQHGKTTTKYTYYSRLGCAMNGIQTLLGGINPCASSGCGTLTNGVYQNSVDQVSLFTFPEPSSSTSAADDYNCSGKSPSIVPYTYPSSTGTSYSPGSGNPTYQITPFMSNYQTIDSSGDGSGTLSTSSSSYVSLAVGAESGCGMEDPGGEGTYYAGVIYAAQAALTAQQAAEAKNGLTAKNVMIIVSDGAATSEQSQMSSSGLLTTGLYPSYYNECAQAVTAAQAATAAGTTVYSVAYGATDTGCTTDTKSGGISSPCTTMQDMATSSATFYSDNNESGTSSDCYSSNSPADLADIFTMIYTNLTNTRLIANSVFPAS